MIAEAAASFRRSWRREKRLEISCRTGAVISTCRPVISSRIMMKFPVPGLQFPVREVTGNSSSVSSPTGNWELATGNFSEEHFSLVRCWNLQLLAILRDGAAGKHQTLLLEDAHDFRVAQRLARILVLDDLADSLFDGDRRDALAERAADPAVEKVFQLEDALRRVHVLVVDDAADRRFVHADVVGHMAKHQGGEILDSLLGEAAVE